MCLFCDAIVTVVVCFIPLSLLGLIERYVDSLVLTRRGEAAQLQPKVSRWLCLHEVAQTNLETFVRHHP